MFSCLQILEAFLWFVLITLLNVTLIILTLSVSRLLNLLLRLVAFLGSAGMPRSEERFSRNAETDLVCRLLLEKKKHPALRGPATRRRRGAEPAPRPRRRRPPRDPAQRADEVGLAGAQPGLPVRLAVP